MRSTQAAIKVSFAQAEAALVQARRMVTTQKWYILGIQDCATKCRKIAGAAGVEAPMTAVTPKQTFEWFQSLAKDPPKF